MFAYPLTSIPTHFQLILIENESNPIGIDPNFEFSLRFYPPNDINDINEKELPSHVLFCLTDYVVARETKAGS